MPRYRVTLSDGRAVTVEADQPPSEQDVLGALGGSAPEKVAKTTFANEPTTYEEGYNKSLRDTASRTGSAILGGLGHALNPLTYLQGPTAEHARMRAEATGERPPTTDYGMGEARALAESLSTPEGGGEAIGTLLPGLLGPRLMTSAKSTAANLPTGRILTAAAEGAKAGASRLPVVGPPLRAAARASRQAWKASAPEVLVADVAPPSEMPPPEVLPPEPPITEPGPMLGPQPKPRLSAPEAAAYLRDEVGSEKAGRMMFGKGHGARGVPPAERQAAIKRLAPGESALPAKAARQMDDALASASPAEAYAYAQKAPNARAQDYFGERLTGPARDIAIRQMLLDMMKTR